MKQGRIVIITGAAGELGTLFVDRFLANGDTIIATGDSEEGLNKLEKKAQLYTTVTDISDEASCAKLAEFARDETGRVDVLINCAGYSPRQSFDEMSLAEWNKIIAVNLTGDFLMAKTMLPLMREEVGAGSSVSDQAPSMRVCRN